MIHRTSIHLSYQYEIYISTTYVPNTQISVKLNSHYVGNNTPVNKYLLITYLGPKYIYKSSTDHSKASSTLVHKSVSFLRSDRKYVSVFMYRYIFTYAGISADGRFMHCLMFLLWHSSFFQEEKMDFSISIVISRNDVFTSICISYIFR